MNARSSGDAQSARENAIDCAMARYAQGDEAAFNLLFQGLGPRLRALLRHWCGCSTLTEDLLQDTFLLMHRARASFVPGSRVLPWASAIARNCFMIHLRTERRRLPARSAQDLESSARTGPEANAELAVCARECARVVAQTLTNMPLAQGQAFQLLRCEGMSLHAAANLLRVSPNVLKLRAFRASEVVRDALERMERHQRKRRAAVFEAAE